MIPQSYPLYAMVVDDDRWDVMTEGQVPDMADVCMVVAWDSDLVPVLVELGGHTNGRSPLWEISDKVNYELMAEMPTESERAEYAAAIAAAVRRIAASDAVSNARPTSATPQVTESSPVPQTGENDL